ncbi:MAG: hypothetical protein V3S98_09540, partial [Dehalococcoidia bacterium]
TSLEHPRSAEPVAGDEAGTGRLVVQLVDRPVDRPVVQPVDRREVRQVRAADVRQHPTRP